MRVHEVVKESGIGLRRSPDDQQVDAIRAVEITRDDNRRSCSSSSHYNQVTLEDLRLPVEIVRCRAYAHEVRHRYAALSDVQGAEARDALINVVLRGPHDDADRDLRHDLLEPPRPPMRRNL